MSEGGHSLLLAFDNQSRDFALGVEVGRVWVLLSATDDALDCEMHTANAEMVLRLAEATGRTVRWVEHDNTWSTAYFAAPA